MVLARNGECSCRGEGAGGGIEDFKRASWRARAFTAGDQDAAVSKERGRVARARGQHRIADGPGASRRVVKFSLACGASRRGSASDEDAAIFESDGSRAPAGEQHRSGSRESATIEDFR